MKFSIITVSYNAESSIKRTIDSVLSQDFYDYEYFVIDGESSDSTTEILKNSNVRFTSEKDNGIYDAMNKGLKMATGEWILFLNAGDAFSSTDVLKKVDELLDQTVDICYGDVILEQFGLYKYKKADDLFNIKNGMVFCHQSVFVNKRITQKHLYDANYQVLADFDFFLKEYLCGSTFQHIRIPISIYELGGFSEKNIKRSKIEKERIQEANHCPVRQNLFSDTRARLVSKIMLTKIGKSLTIKRRLNNGWVNKLSEALITNE